jgi:nucleotide sugar dehydrogenase
MPISEVLRRQLDGSAAGQPAGISLVVDHDGRLIGTLTDGDIRRAVAAGHSLERAASRLMNDSPITFLDGKSYREILDDLPDELARRGSRSARYLSKIVLVDEDHRPTRVLDYHELWAQRVAMHRHVVVVGLGYVGLTLSMVLAEEGFLVTGIDVSEPVVNSLRRGESHIHEVGLVELLREQLDRYFEVNSAIPDDGDMFVICVGTPVVDDESPRPSLEALEAALRAVGERLSQGALVILRSTVPIGTTRTIAAPILEEASGLRAGLDFRLAYAPERTSEGEALRELRELPQIIGGIDDDSVDATAALFRELTPSIVRMESLEAAEMAKLINNSFRDMIFSFSNQVARVAERWGFDVVDAIRGANHGYSRDPVPMPSPGVGGPCLSKDPYILASAFGIQREPTLFDHGRWINESMHRFVVDRLIAALVSAGRDPAEATVLLCGLAFKGDPETDDLRDSSALAIAQALEGRVGRLLGHDPVVGKDLIAEVGLEPVELPPETPGVDAICFLNNHVLYQRLDIFETVRGLAPDPVVFDGWHLYRPDEVTSAAPCLYVGLSFERSSLLL